MQELSYDQIESIISNRVWKKLIGQFENKVLDVKEQPYPVAKSEKAKSDLAKDVTAFANTVGGFIIIGISTPSKESIAHLAQKLEKLRPFVQEKLDADAYIKILGDWVCPGIRGLQIWWEPAKKGSKKGYGIIKVPLQRDEDKPFIVGKTLSEDEEKRYEALFGYVERTMHSNVPIRSCQDLQKMLRDGNSISPRLDGIEETLKKIQQAVAGTRPHRRQINRRRELQKLKGEPKDE